MRMHAYVYVHARAHDANVCTEYVHRIHTCTPHTPICSYFIVFQRNNAVSVRRAGSSGMKNQNFNFVIQMSWADRTSFRMSLNPPNIQIATRSTNFCPDHFEPEHGQIGRTTYIGLRPISGRAYNLNCMRT